MATPFQCSPLGYIVYANQPNNSIFSQVNLVTGKVTQISVLSSLVIGIGYNTTDNLIYGYDISGNIITIDATGTLSTLGLIPNLPSSTFNNSTFDLDGHLFLYSDSFPNYYVVDLKSSSPTYMQLVDPTAGFVLDTAPYGTALSSPITTSDWAFNPVDNQLYAVNISGSVLRINPTTGEVTTLTTTDLPAQTYSIAYFNNYGNLYVGGGDGGEIFQVVISGDTAGAVFLDFLPDIFDITDGASCPLAELEVDFGDAPNTGFGAGPDDYSTLLLNNGPRHQIINQLFLGTIVTAEHDAYQNPTATGDDLILNVPDDGVSFPLPLLKLDSTNYSFVETVTNNTGRNANLYAWVDFEGNGIFQVKDAVIGIPILIPPTVSGTQSVILNFTVPTGLVAISDHTFIRVRITTDTLTTLNAPESEDYRAYGPASDGEVEDYYIDVAYAADLRNPIKSIDKPFADVGTTLTYTVTIVNIGSSTANNVIFVDTIPTGTKFVSDSLTLNGVQQLGLDPSPPGGVSIGQISGGQTSTLTFKVVVNNTIPSPNPISNIGTVGYDFIADPTLLITSTGVHNTNTVNTTINHADIGNIIKSTDKSYCKCGDIITYTISIPNQGNIDALNVVLIDTIPNGTIYIPGSLELNGNPIGGTPTSINIGTIPTGNTSVVTFKVQVIC